MISRTGRTGMISSTQRDQASSFGALDRAEGHLSAHDAEAPMPDDKWPLWKTVAFVMVYCTLAWTLIGTGIWFLLR